MVAAAAVDSIMMEGNDLLLMTRQFCRNPPMKYLNYHEEWCGSFSSSSTVYDP
jgi:hypothetical protein